MQKIDLYQNLLNNFNLDDYKKADLQVIFSTILPYTTQQNADGSTTYIESNKQLTEDWKKYEILRKEQNITLIKEWHQVQETKYMDFWLNLIYHLVGGDGITSVDDVKKLYDAGFRSMQLVYESDNALAHCYKSTEGGLTEVGKDIVQRMDKNKMIIDTANMNHQSMVDVYKYTKKPIMNSHTSVGNIKDEFLDIIAQSNGIIWLNNKEANIDEHIKQIQYIRDRIGDDNIASWSWPVDKLASLEQKIIEVFWAKFAQRFFRENAYRFIMETL